MVFSIIIAVKKGPKSLNAFVKILKQQKFKTSHETLLIAHASTAF